MVEETLCTLSVVGAETWIVPGELAHDFGGYVLEGVLEVVGVGDEACNPTLGFKVHDAVVFCVGGFGDVGVCEVSLAGPVF